MVYLYSDALSSRMNKVYSSSMNKVSSSMNKVSICHLVESFKMLDDASTCKE